MSQKAHVTSHSMSEVSYLSRLGLLSVSEMPLFLGCGPLLPLPPCSVSEEVRLRPLPIWRWGVPEAFTVVTEGPWPCRWLWLGLEWESKNPLVFGLRGEDDSSPPLSTWSWILRLYHTASACKPCSTGLWPYEPLASTEELNHSSSAPELSDWDSRVWRRSLPNWTLSPLMMPLSRAGTLPCLKVPIGTAFWGALLCWWFWQDWSISLLACLFWIVWREKKQQVETRAISSAWRWYCTHTHWLVNSLFPSRLFT